MPYSGPSKRPENLRKSHCGLQRLCVRHERHEDWLPRLLAATLSRKVDRVLSNSQSDIISTPCCLFCLPSLCSRPILEGSNIKHYLSTAECQ